MTIITVRGNMTAPAELRYTSSGKPVASVTVAENIGKDDQKRTNFHRVTLWGELGEHAASLDKGTSVIVVGRLEEREYESREGEKRRAWEIIADAFGPDLRFQTATVQRTGSGVGQSRPQVAQDEPWSTPGSAAPDTWTAPGSYGDDTPF